MLHYDSLMRQFNKAGKDLCGDHCLTFSFKDSYYFAIFDGVGSGVYANLAAIGNAGRWGRMIREGISISEACETLARDMEKAKGQSAPFTAFSALMLTRYGNALVYSYESPRPILLRDYVSQVLEPRFYPIGQGFLGETRLDLEEDDSLFLFSDGISQAGLGGLYPLGWGEEGAASYIQVCSREKKGSQILDCLVQRCLLLSGGSHADDTSVLMIKAVRAKHLSLFSGPPASRGQDQAFARAFEGAQGVRVVCGSSTAEVLARERGVRLSFLSEGQGLHSPPQYRMKGADLVTEGALALNQAANLLEEEGNGFDGQTPAEKLARLLMKADVIDIYEGMAKNEAHRALFFRQLGIRPRKDALRSLMNSLEAMGKRIHYHAF